MFRFIHVPSMCLKPSNILSEGLRPKHLRIPISFRRDLKVYSAKNSLTLRPSRVNYPWASRYSSRVRFLIGSSELKIYFSYWCYNWKCTLQDDCCCHVGCRNGGISEICFLNWYVVSSTLAPDMVCSSVYKFTSYVSGKNWSEITLLTRWVPILDARHTSHTIIGDYYSVGWPPRNTVRAFVSLIATLWRVTNTLKINDVTVKSPNRPIERCVAVGVLMLHALNQRRTSLC